jgi:hypothetical protein
MKIFAASFAQDGAVMLGDGVGAVTRGDMLVALYVGDASIQRSAWLFDLAQSLCERNSQGIVAMVIIPQTSKPPNQETRNAEVVGYKRLGKRLRRAVSVPEGHGFHMSIVRMVIGAYITLTGLGESHYVAKSLEHGVSLITAARSARTPDANQILADIARLRSALTRPSMPS